MSFRIPALCALFSCLVGCGAPADFANEVTSEGAAQVDESSSELVIPPPPKFPGHLVARAIGLWGCAPNLQVQLEVKNVGLGPSNEKLKITLESEGTYFNVICRTTERGTQCIFDQSRPWIWGETSYPDTPVVVPALTTQYVFLPVTLFTPRYAERLSFWATVTSNYTTTETRNLATWVRTDPVLKPDGSNPSIVCPR